MACLLSGMALFCLSLIVWVIRVTWLRSTEKDSVYFAGHWFDAFWEVQLPLMAASAVLLLAGTVRIKPARSDGRR